MCKKMTFRAGKKYVGMDNTGKKLFENINM